MKPSRLFWTLCFFFLFVCCEKPLLPDEDMEEIAKSKRNVTLSIKQLEQLPFALLTTKSDYESPTHLNFAV